jgi:hypothetical protein
VEVPPHYDTFAEFTYSYHYGDSYVPYIKQDEPLKLECQHFLDCVRSGARPITDGRLGLEVVRILEASGESLRQQGAAVALESVVERTNGNGHANGKRNGNGHDHNHANGNGNGHSHAEATRPGVITVPATEAGLVPA